MESHSEHVGRNAQTEYRLEIYSEASCVHRERMAVARVATFRMKDRAIDYRAAFERDVDRVGESRVLALTNPVDVEDAPPKDS